MREQGLAHTPVNALDASHRHLFHDALAWEVHLSIARQSTWQGRVNHDGRGSRGSRSMLQLIVAGKLLLVALLRS